MKTADPSGDGELEYKELLAVLKEPKKVMGAVKCLAKTACPS